MSGVVVILNGPSASGKSTLQKMVQQKSNELFLAVGVDTFFDQLLPDMGNEGDDLEQYTLDDELIRKIEFVKDDDGNVCIPLTVGSAGFSVVQGMHRAIAAYAQAGNNVIVDYIAYDEPWLPDLIQALDGCKTYLVGVYADLHDLEQRERKRGTSPVGHARSHYYHVHRGVEYDAIVNTSKLSPEQAADHVLSIIK